MSKLVAHSITDNLSKHIASTLINYMSKYLFKTTSEIFKLFETTSLISISVDKIVGFLKTMAGASYFMAKDRVNIRRVSRILNRGREFFEVVILSFAKVREWIEEKQG